MTAGGVRPTVLILRPLRRGGLARTDGHQVKTSLLVQYNSHVKLWFNLFNQNTMHRLSLFRFAFKTPGIVQIFVAFWLSIFPAFSDAVSFMDNFTPGISYYYDDFDHEQSPWEPGQALNVEEVFKNYQYYEIMLGQNGKEITVNQYINGKRTNSEKYLLSPGGALLKK
jgi:hypothetical protein